MLLTKTLRTSMIAATIGIAGAFVVLSAQARQFAGESFEIAKFTIDGGGGTSTGGSFDLTGTIGQPDAATMTGGTFELAGGFWPSGVGRAPTNCPADIAPPPNGNTLVNVDDLLAVINGWGPCGAPCPPHCIADVAPLPNGNCVVNVDDLLAIINAWGLCP